MGSLEIDTRPADLASYSQVLAASWLVLAGSAPQMPCPAEILKARSQLDSSRSARRCLRLGAVRTGQATIEFRGMS